MNTRFLRSLLIFGLLCGWVTAQDAGVPMPARVIGDISTNNPSPVVHQRAQPDFKINRQMVHQKNGYKFVINKVQKPLLQSDHSADAVSQEEMKRRSDELVKWIKSVRESGGFFAVSATIYDHKTTYVRWQNGKKVFAAWSNVNWNHLGGFENFEGRGKLYNMSLFSSNVSTNPSRAELWAGARMNPPKIPPLPSLDEKGASYMMVVGDESDDSAMEFIEAIHDLYEAHRPILEEAWNERRDNNLAHLERQRRLRNNAPDKPDETVNYWLQTPSGNKPSTK